MANLFGAALRMLQLSGTPATPAAGETKVYVKSDGLLYRLGSDGVERPVDTSSGVYVPAVVADITSTATTVTTSGTWTTLLGPFTPTGTPFTSGVSSGVWTWSVAGMFLFNASIGFAAGTASRRAIRFQKNGVEVRRHDIGSTTTTSIVQVTHMMPMAVGDTFAVQAFQNSGSLALDTSALPHEWQAWKISDATAFG